MNIYLGLNRILKIGKNHGGYFITTFINTAIPVFLLPILTRYLTPAEYANIALFSFYMLLSNSLTGTAIPIAISKDYFDKPKDHVAKIIGNSILIVLFLSIILSVLIIIFRSSIAGFIDLPIFWIVIVPWCSFFYIIFCIGLTVMRNQKKVATFSYHKIGNTLINVSISILLVVVLIYGWQGRVWGIILSYFISSILSFFYLKSLGFVSFSFSKSIQKRILSILVPLIPNSFQTVIISQVGIFFMQYFFTKELLGLYSVGYRISYSIHLLYATISLTWSPFLYEQLADYSTINKDKIVRYLYILSGILFSGAIVVFLFMNFILKLLTTESYLGASEFIPWLCLGTVFQGFSIFITPILIKKEKQNFLSITSLINMFAMIGFNFLFIHFYGYIGIVYAFALTNFLIFAPMAIITQKVLPLPWIKAIIIWRK